MVSSSSGSGNVVVPRLSGFIRQFGRVSARRKHADPVDQDQALQRRRKQKDQQHKGYISSVRTSLTPIEDYGNRFSFQIGTMELLEKIVQKSQRPQLSPRQSSGNVWHRKHRSSPD